MPPTASESDSDGADEAQSGASNQSDRHDDLEAFKQQVNAEIESLGGHIVPKLNWSAPVDAQWISPTGLRCQNADEVLLLLKSSDRAAHDLASVRELQRAAHGGPALAHDGDEGKGTEQGDHTPVVRPQLVLKRYHDLDNGLEFRCFVLKGHLAGVSQRDPTQHFPALVDEQPAIKAALLTFFIDKISSRFPSRNCALSQVPVHHACNAHASLCQRENSRVVAMARLIVLQPIAQPGLVNSTHKASLTGADVFDVYVAPKHRVWLLDFNPPGETTQPLLFTWPEIHEAAQLMQDVPGCSNHEFEMRVVTGSLHVQAGAQSVFGVPADTLQLQGMTWGGVMQLLESEVSKQNLQDG